MWNTTVIGVLGSRDGSLHPLSFGITINTLLICCLVALVDGSIIKHDVMALVEVGLKATREYMIRV